MKSTARRWHRLAVASFVLGAVSCGLVAWNGWWVLHSPGWPAVPGTILSAELQVPGRGGPDRARIRYRYTVQGQAYESDRIGYLLPVTDACARSWLAGRTAGAAVTVHHDPRSPSRAVLQPGGRGRLAAAGVFAAALLALGGYARRRARAVR